VTCTDGLDRAPVPPQELVQRLRELDEFAIDRCLEAYTTTTDDDLGDSLADVFSQCATHDERIYGVLLDTLERSPELGAMYLAEYGDPRAVPALSQRFDALPISDEDSPLANHVFVELRAAIEDLGGHLTAAQAAKAERADAPRRRFAAQIEGLICHMAEQPQRAEQALPPPSVGRGNATQKQPKFGRNAPCWCGSGKEYKKCHLDLERS
jgi:hypothetical protein